MENIKNNDNNNNSEINEKINNNGETFQRICKLQKLIKKESALKELCKKLLYYLTEKNALIYS